MKDLKELIKLNNNKKVLRTCVYVLMAILGLLSAAIIWAVESDLVSLFGGVCLIIIIIALVAVMYFCIYKIEKIELDCDDCYFRCKVVDLEASLYTRFNELANEYYNECNNNGGREGSTKSFALVCEIGEVQNIMKQMCMEYIPELKRMR